MFEHNIRDVLTSWRASGVHTRKRWKCSKEQSLFLQEYNNYSPEVDILIRFSRGKLGSWRAKGKVITHYSKKENSRT